MNKPPPANSVLLAVKQNLQRSDREEVPLPAILPRVAPSTDPAALFVERARSAGCHCFVAGDLREAREHFASLCQSKGFKQIVRSDSALVNDLLSEPPEGVAVEGAIERRASLFAADAGMCEAQWGIAETGTLVLASGTEKHRLTSLVPPTHIALIPATRIVSTMLAVLEQLRQSGLPHQAVTMVTGPSRTADIELTLVVGVHGPKEQHIIVLRDR